MKMRRLTKFINNALVFMLLFMLYGFFVCFLHFRYTKKLDVVGGVLDVIGELKSERYKASSSNNVYKNRNKKIPSTTKTKIKPTKRVLLESKYEIKPFSKTRILCLVLTVPENIRTKGKTVLETWGQKCDVILFMSTQKDEIYPQVVALDVNENYQWEKTKSAWQYVYDNHFNDADWFLKADDDTFVLVDNLRSYLTNYNTNEKYYFGFELKNDGGYCGGGAGYVLSKETLKSLTVAMKKKECRYSISGGIGVGKCLREHGIKPTDSRDELGRYRFHPLQPRTLFDKNGIKGYSKWYKTFAKHGAQFGAECCSDTSVSFHYLNIKMIRDLYKLCARVGDANCIKELRKDYSQF